LPVLGTLGVVFRTKKQGLIRQAARMLPASRTAGLHLGDLPSDRYWAALV